MQTGGPFLTDRAESKKASRRVVMREQDPAARIRNFDEVPFGYSESEAVVEARRCLNCRKPPCVRGCPVEVPIPEFVRLVADGEFAAAAAKIREANLLPAVCGRVCPQEEQCEKVCVLAKKGEAIAVGNLERFAADRDRERDGAATPNRLPRAGKKIAVVGSGPAGLTVAVELAKKGCDVVIFEALHEAGGVLTYGIPEFRLPKEIVRAEIGALEGLGVRIVRNFVVGRTETIDGLLDDEAFDAVFVGSGAGLPTFLNVPGENGIGVYSANEYLTRSNLMKAYAEGSATPIIRGRRVVTVGGGNVAMDSARTALRLGAEKSIVVYRRGRDEMPARKAEIHHAAEEGVAFHFLCNPVEVLTDTDGFVRGVRCQRMKLGEPDASGRRSPIPLAGDEFEIECDAVIVAVGNRPNPLIPATTPDIRTTAKGTVVAGADDGRTSKPFVYAGGDIVTGAATVILAMGAGKAAARSIMEDLGIAPSAGDRRE